MKKYYSVVSWVDDYGHSKINLGDIITADRMPENEVLETKRKTFYTDWFDSLEAAKNFVNENKEV